MKAIRVTLAVLAALLLAATNAHGQTATPTPGSNDACDCTGVCSAPVGGSCGVCTIVRGASCVNGAAATHTPTRTPTSTRTPTATHTITSTPLATSTPTTTHVPASTPQSTQPAASSAVVTSWRTQAFSSTATKVALVPGIRTQRVALTYIEAVADAATVVTVTVGSQTVTFDFITANLNVPQWRSFPIPLSSALGGDVYVSQTGSANVTVNTLSYMSTK